MMQPKYKHNSEQKDFIRKQWINFIKELCEQNDVNKDNISMLTLPSSELQELNLYHQEGIIQAEITETRALRISSGKICCFEKRSAEFTELNSKIAGLSYIINNDVCSYIKSEFQKLQSGSIDLFPLDIINLDFDGSLSNLKVPFDELFSLIFMLQSTNSKNFSFFLTFPETEKNDQAIYKQKIKNIIDSNLSDNLNTKFINTFKKYFDKIETLEYEKMHLMSIAKSMIEKASQYNYDVSKAVFYIYGVKEKDRKKEERQRMHSILFNFYFSNSRKTPPSLYYKNVFLSIESIEELN